MKQASYMLPPELIKQVEDLCYRRNITQDEIVRRAVAEYVAKDAREASMSEVPTRDIKTHLASHG